MIDRRAFLSFDDGLLLSPALGRRVARSEKRRKIEINIINAMLGRQLAKRDGSTLTGELDGCSGRTVRLPVR